MPATPEQLERRISRLERDVQAARGIGTKAVMRNNLDHGGYQSENMANPASDADAQNKAASAGSFAALAHVHEGTVIKSTGEAAGTKFLREDGDGTCSWQSTLTGDITGVTAGTGLSGGGTSGAVTLDIDSTVVTKTGTHTLTNKTLTSPTMTAPALGTPASGTLTNCTFPTLNQDTTGTAATVTAGTQAAITTCTNLVTTGALDSGSITSGFTSIDIGSGALSTTGSSRLGRTGINVAANANQTCYIAETREPSSGTAAYSNLYTSLTAEPASGGGGSAFRGLNVNVASAGSENLTSALALVGLGFVTKHNVATTATAMYGVYGQAFVGPSSGTGGPGAIATNIHGGLMQAKVSSGHASPLPGTAIGGEFISTYANTNTVAGLTAGKFSPKLTAAGTVTNMYGIDVDLSGVATDGSTVGTGRAIAVDGWGQGDTSNDDYPTYSNAPVQLYLGSNTEEAAVPIHQVGSAAESLLEGKLTVNGQLTSAVADGTAPLVVTSKTAVANLATAMAYGYGRSTADGTLGNSKIKLGAGTTLTTASSDMTWNDTSDDWNIDVAGVYEVLFVANISGGGTSSNLTLSIDKDGSAEISLFTRLEVSDDPEPRTLSWVGTLAVNEKISAAHDSGFYNMKLVAGSSLLVRRIG